MGIDYIALFVDDVERSIVFYRDLLGLEFPKPPKNGGTEGISGNLKLGIYDRTWLVKLFGDRLESHQAGHAFLLSLPVADLGAFYQTLVTAGVEIVSPPKKMPWGQEIVFFKDPDGNLLEAVQA
ncbi:Glyoxalase/bleomycin resistance protein/dioxygenase [Thalassoporum mexicanum PCC 7367]|uniref:VOC family protein n=1 Tax=Thalassoporum mexicanum TaxID=3457544 RepID=UPI00029FBB12|nr:VOC family protein [Pseudanabaena sp. PCC 7367]AFY69574.1 Glyoxalase/bleomycin resistance protein/dioxygenase [Pseudanabaena sp. PCC 7367]